MSNPFSRANAMMALIAAAMGNQAALSAIGPYVSRGHGRGQFRIKSWFSLSARKRSSKYKPHQGKRECARRVRQMEAAQ